MNQPKPPTQKVIIPRGVVSKDETAVIEIPLEFQDEPIVVVTSRLDSRDSEYARSYRSARSPGNERDASGRVGRFGAVLLDNAPHPCSPADASQSLGVIRTEKRGNFAQGRCDRSNAGAVNTGGVTNTAFSSSMPVLYSVSPNQYTGFPRLNQRDEQCGCDDHSLFNAPQSSRCDEPACPLLQTTYQSLGIPAGMYNQYTYNNSMRMASPYDSTNRSLGILQPNQMNTSFGGCIDPSCSNKPGLPGCADPVCENLNGPLLSCVGTDPPSFEVGPQNEMRAAGQQTNMAFDGYAPPVLEAGLPSGCCADLLELGIEPECMKGMLSAVQAPSFYSTCSGECLALTPPNQMKDAYNSTQPQFIDSTGTQSLGLMPPSQMNDTFGSARAQPASASCCIRALISPDAPPCGDPSCPDAASLGILQHSQMRTFSQPSRGSAASTPKGAQLTDTFNQPSREPLPIAASTPREAQMNDTFSQIGRGPLAASTPRQFVQPMENSASAEPCCAGMLNPCGHTECPDSPSLGILQPSQMRDTLETPKAPPSTPCTSLGLLPESEMQNTGYCTMSKPCDDPICPNTSSLGILHPSQMKDGSSVGAAISASACPTDQSLDVLPPAQIPDSFAPVATSTPTGSGSADSASLGLIPVSQMRGASMDSSVNKQSMAQEIFKTSEMPAAASGYGADYTPSAKDDSSGAKTQPSVESGSRVGDTTSLGSTPQGGMKDLAGKNHCGLGTCSVPRPAPGASPFSDIVSSSTISEVGVNIPKVPESVHSSEYSVPKSGLDTTDASGISGKKTDQGDTSLGILDSTKLDDAFSQSGASERSAGKRPDKDDTSLGILDSKKMDDTFSQGTASGRSGLSQGNLERSAATAGKGIDGLDDLGQSRLADTGDLSLGILDTKKMDDTFSQSAASASSARTTDKGDNTGGASLGILDSKQMNDTFSQSAASASSAGTTGKSADKGGTSLGVLDSKTDDTFSQSAASEKSGAGQGKGTGIDTTGSAKSASQGKEPGIGATDSERSAGGLGQNKTAGKDPQVTGADKSPDGKTGADKDPGGMGVGQTGSVGTTSKPSEYSTASSAKGATEKELKDKKAGLAASKTGGAVAIANKTSSKSGCKYKCGIASCGFVREITGESDSWSRIPVPTGTRCNRYNCPKLRRLRNAENVDRKPSFDDDKGSMRPKDSQASSRSRGNQPASKPGFDNPPGSIGPRGSSSSKSPQMSDNKVAFQRGYHASYLSRIPELDDSGAAASQMPLTGNRGNPNLASKGEPSPGSSIADSSRRMPAQKECPTIASLPQSTGTSSKVTPELTLTTAALDSNSRVPNTGQEVTCKAECPLASPLQPDGQLKTTLKEECLKSSNVVPASKEMSLIGSSLGNQTDISSDKRGSSISSLLRAITNSTIRSSMADTSLGLVSSYPSSLCKAAADSRLDSSLGVLRGSQMGSSCDEECPDRLSSSPPPATADTKGDSSLGILNSEQMETPCKEECPGLISMVDTSPGDVSRYPPSLCKAAADSRLDSSLGVLRSSEMGSFCDEECPDRLLSSPSPATSDTKGDSSLGILNSEQMETPCKDECPGLSKQAYTSPDSSLGILKPCQMEIPCKEECPVAKGESSTSSSSSESSLGILRSSEMESPCRNVFPRPFSLPQTPVCQRPTSLSSPSSAGQDTRPGISIPCKAEYSTRAGRQRKTEKAQSFQPCVRRPQQIPLRDRSPILTRCDPNPPSKDWSPKSWLPPRITYQNKTYDQSQHSGMGLLRTQQQYNRSRPLLCAIRGRYPNSYYQVAQIRGLCRTFSQISTTSSVDEQEELEKSRLDAFSSSQSTLGMLRNQMVYSSTCPTPTNSLRAMNSSQLDSSAGSIPRIPLPAPQAQSTPYSAKIVVIDEPSPGSSTSRVPCFSRQRYSSLGLLPSLQMDSYLYARAVLSDKTRTSKSLGMVSCDRECSPEDISTQKERMSLSLQRKLFAAERTEREMLENDLRSYQHARRRLISDAADMSCLAALRNDD